MGLQRGAFDLASAFAGGGASYNAAKLLAEKNSMLSAGLHADTDRKVDLAIEEQQKRMAVQAVADDPKLDTLTKNLVIGKLGQSFAGVQLGNLRAQEIVARDAARTAALKGEWGDANANMLGVASGPQATTAVQGGMILSNRFDPDAPVTVNDIGASQIAQHAAAAASSYATAGAANARRAKTLDEIADPAKYHAPGKGKTAAFTAPTEGELLMYFGNPRVPGGRGPDGLPVEWTPADVAKRNAAIRAFDDWRVAHPEYPRGSEALAAFKHGARTNDVAARRGLAAAFAGDGPGVSPGAGTQIATPHGAVTPKVPGVPETHGVTAVAPTRAPPVAGARQSPIDGKWYIPDPNRRGKYLRVD